MLKNSKSDCQIEIFYVERKPEIICIIEKKKKLKLSYFKPDTHQSIS